MPHPLMTTMLASSALYNGKNGGYPRSCKMATNDYIPVRSNVTPLFTTQTNGRKHLWRRKNI